MSQRRRNLRANLDEELEQELAAREQGQGATSPIAGASSPALPVQATQSVQALQPAPIPGPSTQSRAHLVQHRAPRAETVEDHFENVYQRETYYIDRAYHPKLRQLMKDSGNTKTALMNEALDLLFAKYGVQ